MDELIQNLYTILEQEQRTHTELLLTAEELNQAIKAGELTKVQHLTGIYDQQIGGMQTSEERRLELCDQMARHLGLNLRHVNLKALIPHFNTDERPRFTAMAASLKELLTRLVQVNTTNQVLLHESISVMNQKMEKYVTAGQKTYGYKQSGAPETGSSSRRFFNQTA